VEFYRRMARDVGMLPHEIIRAMIEGAAWKKMNLP